MKGVRFGDPSVTPYVPRCTELLRAKVETDAGGSRSAARGNRATECRSVSSTVSRVLVHEPEPKKHHVDGRILSVRFEPGEHRAVCRSSSGWIDRDEVPVDLEVVRNCREHCPALPKPGEGQIRVERTVEDGA